MKIMQDKQFIKVIQCCISNPQILEYMQINQYPIWQSPNNNQISFYLPLSNYLCLSDLLMGKKCKYIKVNQDALETLFIMLYDLLQELKEKQLTYFLIKKEHIWVQLNDKAIIKLILASPIDQVVSIFEEGSKTRIDRQVFKEIMACFQKKSKNGDRFKNYIEKDIHKVKEVRQINRKPCIIVEQSLKKIINNIDIKEKFEKQNTNNHDILLQKVLEVLPYFIFENKIQNSDSSKAQDLLQNQLQQIYQYCEEYDKTRYGLEIFLQFPETFMFFNDLNKFIQGDFFTQYLQFMKRTAVILQLFQQVESYFNIIPKISILKEIETQNLYQDHQKLLDFIQEQVMKYIKQVLNQII